MPSEIFATASLDEISGTSDGCKDAALLPEFLPGTRSLGAAEDRAGKPPRLPAAGVFYLNLGAGPCRGARFWYGRALDLGVPEAKPPRCILETRG